jgi:CDP-diacylglycerol--glycerol-3-phosphate 3-phosphatidyltransferase
MLNRYARAFAAWLLTPVASLLLRLGMGPDAVTVLGTLGVAGSALWFYPRGELWLGTVAVTVFVLSDSVDGLMARMLRDRGVQRSARWGAFLDSTCDRVGDAAVFGGLVVWFTGAGADRPTALLALLCLVLGSIVPYARARAEGLGMTASVGIAERADRLMLVLVATFAVGVGAPTAVLTLVLGLLAVASAVTVVQRVLTVRRQCTTAASGDQTGTQSEQGVEP